MRSDGPSPPLRPPVRRRALVIVQGPLGERPAGPEIRGLAIARALAAHHDVTVAATATGPCVRHGLRVVPRSRASLVRELRRHEIVVGPLLPPYALTTLATRRCTRVADLYDPVELELGTLGHGRRARNAVAEQRALRTLQLRWSDIVVCANDRQRERAVRDLAAVGRSAAGPVLVTVPMGLPEPPPRPAARPLREAFAIPDRAPLLLWWGTVWRWLDAETAIRAVGRLARHRPDIRFVITAGPPPNRATDVLNATEDARRLARELGLLDRHVFFFDDWIPYEERHRYLADADAGLILHAAGPEAALAARSRYTDLLWAGLPSILASGDELADAMAAGGAARLVPPRDVTATAAAIAALLDDADGLRRAGEACRALAERYRWPAVVAPLVQAIDALAPAAGSGRDALSLTGASGRFYGRRVVARSLGLG